MEKKEEIIIEEINADEEFKDNIKYFELKKMLSSANKAVMAATTATAVTGAVPIPFADAPLMIAEQVSLLASISAIFKIDIKKEGLKTLVISALGIGGATVIGKTVVSGALKLIPGVGTVAGGAISAATAGLLTASMGKAYIELCKAFHMGKLSEEDILSSKGKNMLKSEYQKQLRLNNKKSKSKKSNKK